MNVEIFYNDEIDEFTLDLSLKTRLKNYITKNFYAAYAIANLAPVYLVGGAIRDLIYATKPKDLDFIVLGKEHLDWVLDIFCTFNIEYEFNRFGGFKITLPNVSVDLWLADDLFSAIQYNVDGLLFDLRTNSLISLTFNDFLQKGIRQVNEENNIEKGRELKLARFANQYKKN